MAVDANKIFPNWRNASLSDIELFQIIAEMLEKHPFLVRFLFHPMKPELNEGPEVLLRKGSIFSTGEKTMLRISLDLWSSEGGASVADMLDRLDTTNFYKVIAAVQKRRGL
jgi:hypothetical protein